jgi:acetyltransferase-like isoleucine patch superfamily enzyme
MKIVLEAILNLIGKKNYKVSKHLSALDIILIFFYRFFDFFRGSILKLRLGKSQLPIFKGTGGRVLFPKRIYAGKSLNIGNNVFINALSKSTINIGDNFTIKSNTVIDCTGVLSDLGGKLSIGNNVGLSENCFIQVRGDVIIEDNVIVGPGVSIFSENHNFGSSGIPIKDQGVERKGVKISNGCWLGANCTILDGVNLGKNCVVAAGSVVTSSFEANSIIKGIPAK